LVLDVISALVEDHDILFVEVGNVEFKFVNNTVEGESHSELILVEETISCSASPVGGVVFGLHLSSDGGDRHEEGEWHTTALALGEEETAGESTVTVNLFVVVLGLALESIVNVLVYVTVGGEVFYGGEDVLGVANDGVLSDGQLVWESVELNHHSPLLVDVEDAAFNVVFGSNKYTNNGINSLVRLYIDLEVESLVVETPLTSLDVHIVFLLLGHYTAADVEFEGFEVSDELVYLNRFNLDSRESEFLTEVAGQERLEAKEKTRDSSQEAVVQRIAEGSFVVFENSSSDLVGVSVVNDVSQKLNGELVQPSVVVEVDRVSGSFNELSKNVNSTSIGQPNLLSGLGENESHVNGVTDASLEVEDQLEFVVVEVADIVVVWTRWEVLAVGVTELRIVTEFNWNIVVEDINVKKIVGETFKDVSGKKLLVVVVEQFSATFALVTVSRVHPEWAVEVEVVVISVDSNIFGEVRNTVFRAVMLYAVIPVDVALVVVFKMFLGVEVMIEWVVSGLVYWNNVNIVVFVGRSEHSLFESLLDDISINEELGIDFVRRRKNKSMSISAMKNSNRESIVELAGVDVNASPSS